MSNKTRSKNIVRFSEGARVAYYRVSASSQFWDDLWASQVRKPPSAGLSFYQYLYSPSEFNKKLNQAGFQVIAHHQYDGHKGLVAELPWLLKLYNLPKVGWRIYRFMRDWRWANDHMGHMMMYVCRKDSLGSPGKI